MAPAPVISVSWKCICENIPILPTSILKQRLWPPNPTHKLGSIGYSVCILSWSILYPFARESLHCEPFFRTALKNDTNKMIKHVQVWKGLSINLITLICLHHVTHHLEGQIMLRAALTQKCMESIARSQFLDLHKDLSWLKYHVWRNIKYHKFCFVAS